MAFAVIPEFLHFKESTTRSLGAPGDGECVLAQAGRKEFTI